MTKAKTGEREQSSHRWFGAAQEGQVPVHAAGGGAAAARDTDAAGARWLRRIARVLRDAAVAVAIFAMVPVAMVSVSQGYVWSVGAVNTRAKLRQAEPSRAFAPAKDASIQPMQAGLALAALQSEPRNNGAFPLRPVGVRAVRPWENVTLAPELFRSARNAAWRGPSSTTILEATVQGFSARELDFLRMVAKAPVWNDFDLIGRAPAVDILGGRFLLPYPDQALLWEMPIMRFAATKELAYAGVARAAYHLAVGEVPQAEAALRSVIGFGFAIIDNGTFTIDGLIGQVIVGIGRDALERLYTLTGDRRASDVYAARPAVVGRPPVMPGSNRPTVEFLRDQLLKTAENGTAPRTVRYEALNQLAISSCTNVRELLFGTGADIRQAYGRASRDLARFPSERAVLDVALHTVERAGTGANVGVPSGGVVVRLLVGASTVAGVVLDNPRMPFCTRVIAGGRF